MHVEITLADPAPLQAQLKSIYQGAYQNLLQYAYKGEQPVAEYFNWLQRRASEGFLIAFRDRIPIGFIVVESDWITVNDERVGEIHELAVLPAYQGCGVGQQLFTRGLDMLRSHHQHRFELWVGEHNTKAKAMYRHFGFSEQETWFRWLRMTMEESPPVQPS